MHSGCGMPQLPRVTWMNFGPLRSLTRSITRQYGKDSRRHDGSAIPALLILLQDEKNWRWWEMAKHVWSPELAAALDKKLDDRAAIAHDWNDKETDDDWIVSSLMMRLPQEQAESLLTKHWHHLRYWPALRVALYLSTTRLRQLAAVALSGEPPSPRGFQAFGDAYGHQS